MTRCPWPTKPLDIEYHDSEWGVPLREDRALFELLTLEGAQAGLSWSIILKKRDSYRTAFHQFDPEKIASYTEKDTARLLEDAGIVRNRLKIASTIGNARALLALQTRGISFHEWLWTFVDGKPLQPNRKAMTDIPVRSPESEAMSKALLAHGFKFVGSTICYAFMQASGMVNDHLTSCFRHKEVRKL